MSQLGLFLDPTCTTVKHFLEQEGVPYGVVSPTGHFIAVVQEGTVGGTKLRYSADRFSSNVEEEVREWLAVKLVGETRVTFAGLINPTGDLIESRGCPHFPISPVRRWLAPAVAFSLTGAALVGAIFTTRKE